MRRMLGERQAPCPNCGGPIQFRVGTSRAVVCSYCRYSVVRTRDSLEAVGQVADLVPTSPFMNVGDHGVVNGEEFRVHGRLQLDHGAGPWDEWYIEFPRRGGRWAWLAQAQGKFFLSSYIEASGMPAYEQMTPGQRGQIPGGGDIVWAVTERGQSRLVSGEGELPFPIQQDATGRYVDLSGPSKRVATIDYGDGSEPPKLFAGHEIPFSTIEVRGGAVGPRPVQKVEAQKLQCPTCGGPCPIRAPDITERVACQYCGTLLDFNQGALRALAQTNMENKVEPAIPLGAEGTVRGRQMTCIGFMERSTWSGGLFKWREYLMYSGAGGYVWLMEDGGHWTLIEPTPAGGVTFSGFTASRDGNSHKLYNVAEGEVRYVAGEFYWKVKAGDKAMLRDFIAPPHILSSEQTPSEVVWSKGEYIPKKEIGDAFQLKTMPMQFGVGPAQPNPHHTAVPAWVAVIGGGLLMVLAMAMEFFPSGQGLVSQPLGMPAAGGSQPSVSAPFSVDGPTPLRVKLDTTTDNQWVGVDCALENTDTGKTEQFYVDAGRFHGRSGGENWSEGSKDATTYVSAVPDGNYVLHMNTTWQAYPQPGATPALSMPGATINVTAGKRSPMCFLFSLVLIALPFIITWMRRNTFEKRRWENSSL